MGTTEFVVAGLLPELAGDLGVSVSRAGLLITAFALGMIIGSPAMAMATLRPPPRRTRHRRRIGAGGYGPGLLPRPDRPAPGGHRPPWCR
ncbi:hypothetical protein [Streptomyces camelliae]|uniref:Major facilitator superfamily (MFS) profile domain-containing protein n=1 Tax=Streptomyces camelliae TaxID=3004093 RepID=A0ABY7NWU2_9ACTN|nr:hypothetical protein [Streptomyces sp. HUAS 2-6]WBO62694.1 hypothetical protein O1G22_07610 [Streptomyces sp. HUAS 2-6]